MDTKHGTRFDVSFCVVHARYLDVIDTHERGK